MNLDSQAFNSQVVLPPKEPAADIFPFVLIIMQILMPVVRSQYIHHMRNSRM